MKFRFIQRHAEQYRVKMMCSVLGVSRSGYYAWCKRRPSARERANRGLRALIRLLHRKSRRTYGYRRIHAGLVAQGITCGKNRVARLMQEDGLQARRRRLYKRTTQSRHNRPVAHFDNRKVSHLILKKRATYIVTIRKVILRK